MSVAVCIPWVDIGCEHRRRAYEFVSAHWHSLGLEVVSAGGSSVPVNRSAARNECARLTSASVLFFADADTWVADEQFLAATMAAAETHRLVHAYDKLIRLHRAPTQQTYAGRLSPVGQIVFRQPAGCIAVSRKLFERVGGFDERFVGWGGEDRSFQFACDTLAGTGERISGDAYHLWHPRSPEQGRRTVVGIANLKLAARYKTVAGVVRSTGVIGRTPKAKADPEQMLAILREPGGPLHESTIRGTHSVAPIA